MYESVLKVLDVEPYVLEKEILPTADPQKEPLASDQLEKLFNRFRGEIQDE